ncbi:MAG: hypothetical protein NTW86_13965 [Candidatus Sumerlaeota bacterium]|nr:hypothetical protein [Candidatus Sumerlaeota bacterium]
MSAPAAATCYRHPSKSAAARCRRCGKPICRECVIQTADGWFCGMECAEGAAQFQRLVATATPRAGRVFSARRFFAGLAIAAGLWAIFGAIMWARYGIGNPARMLRWLVGMLGALFEWLGHSLGLG